MNELGKELSALLKDGNLGCYTYCKVDQIVLLAKDKKIINYFTHIDFSSKYTQAIPFSYLTSSPKTVSDFRIAISSYTIPVKEFVSLYIKAAQTGKWEYDGESIIIDDAFVSHKKFVPANDPAVSQYNCFVPIEYALYGSNFMGNYYLTELYSKKTVLNKIIGTKEQEQIKKIMQSCKLNYRLDKLTDRIGNIVCKFNIESFRSTPKALGAERGIGFEFEYSEHISRHGLSLSVVQEHDGIIYTNKFIGKFRGKDLKIPPNQYKTQISIIDRKTSLTLFYGVYDYRSYSSNYSQINLQCIAATALEARTLHFVDDDEEVPLCGVQQLGEYREFVEMANANERSKFLEDKWLSEHGYIKSYMHGNHVEAIHDIVSIMNAPGLLWDLQELWVIDPYLCANDIIQTAFYCKKPDIYIKALCAYATINGNREVKGAAGFDGFEDFKNKEKESIENVLGMKTDIHLEYRSVYNGHGVPFHDRYIILKFGINKSRVWSLGASINAIGSTHSTIQIVEAPNQIIALFENLWSQVECEECEIFNNMLKEKENETPIQTSKISS